MNIDVISKGPKESTNRPHLLFVHGAFHTAACWDEFYLPWFAAQGWHAHAISLRGHRKNDVDMHHWHLKDYLEDIEIALQRIGKPVVIVGHSMGGVLAQLAIKNTNDIKAMVLLASSPARRSLSVMLKLLSKSPKAILSSIINKDMKMLRVAMETFFFSEDLRPELRARYTAQLVSESPIAIEEVFNRPAVIHPEHDRRPILVVAGQDDWSIPLADHKKDSMTFRSKLEICRGAHDLMLDPEWRDSAEVINTWLGEHF